MVLVERLRTAIIIGLLILVTILYRQVNEQKLILTEYMGITTKSIENLHERNILMFELIKEHQEKDLHKFLANKKYYALYNERTD